MTSLGRAQILAMIPHSGAMCLLDEVLDWHADWIRCLSHRYGDLDNPLRRPDGTLGAACGIEIAAQAMAVHGWLAGEQGAGPPGPGFLVSLREVRLASSHLDAAARPLVIEATLLARNMRGASYDFTVTGHGTQFLSGRATVLLGANQ